MFDEIARRFWSETRWILRYPWSGSICATAMSMALLVAVVVAPVAAAAGVARQSGTAAEGALPPPGWLSATTAEQWDPALPHTILAEVNEMPSAPAFAVLATGGTKMILEVPPEPRIFGGLVAKLLTTVAKPAALSLAAAISRAAGWTASVIRSVAGAWTVVVRTTGGSLSALVTKLRRWVRARTIAAVLIFEAAVEGVQYIVFRPGREDESPAVLSVPPGQTRQSRIRALQDTYEALTVKGAEARTPQQVAEWRKLACAHHLVVKHYERIYALTFTATYPGSCR